MDQSKQAKADKPKLRKVRRIAGYTAFGWIVLASRTGQSVISDSYKSPYLGKTIKLHVC